LLCDYLQPFPPKGVGYCRYIFVLFKQEKRIDFAKYKRETPCTNLTARTFSTYEFYRDLQDHMTPAGLSFFQSDWDRSLTPFFQNILGKCGHIYTLVILRKACAENRTSYMDLDMTTICQFLVAKNNIPKIASVGLAFNLTWCKCKAMTIPYTVDIYYQLLFLIKNLTSNHFEQI